PRGLELDYRPLRRVGPHAGSRKRRIDVPAAIKMDATRRVPGERQAEPFRKTLFQRNRGVRRVRRDQPGRAGANRDRNQGNAPIHKWVEEGRVRNDDLLLARTIEPEQTFDDLLVQSLVEITEATAK